jgi:hypothetical protein
MDDGLLLLPVVGRERPEVVAARVEEGAVALALKEGGGGRLAEVAGSDVRDRLDLVVRQEPLVRDHGGVQPHFQRSLR